MGMGLPASVALPALAVDLSQVLLKGVQILQISNLSESQEVALGRQIDQQLQQSGNLRFSRDPAVIGWVNQIGQRLVPLSDRPQLPFTFQVVEDEDINAFATMGGFVYITTGAIQAAEQEAQIAAVLAHEISHITEKHGLRQLQQAATTQAGAQILGLNQSDIAAVALELVVRRPQSRENEFAADEKGLWILYRAGYDPRALPTFLTKLLNRGHSPEILSTHPATPERIARLNQMIASNQLDRNPVNNAPIYQPHTQVEIMPMPLLPGLNPPQRLN
jgi:predicted Zn-dependent protease